MRQGFNLETLKPGDTMYVELHARSAFSFLEGASLPELLMARGAQLEMPAMALLDRNGLYGAPRFHMAAQRAGTRAHIGAEIAVRDAGERARPPQWLPHRIPAEPVRWALLAETQTGYQNLCRLITRYQIARGRTRPRAPRCWPMSPNSPGPRLPDRRRRRPAGRGSGARRIRRGAARSRAARAHLWPAQCLTSNCSATSTARRSIAIRPPCASRARCNLPLLATNGVHYATAYEREVLDVLTTIRHHCTLETAGRLLCAQRRALPALPARDAGSSSAIFPRPSPTRRELSARLTYQMSDLGYRFPDYPVPDGETMQSFLEKRTAEGIRNRYLPKHDAKLFARAQTAGAARAHAHRQARTCRILPHRLGHRAVLRARGNPGAGARLGGQQRGLLRPRHHRRRSRRHGPALRALPLRRARRVAGHRSRPAQRRRSASAPFSTSISATANSAPP